MAGEALCPPEFGLPSQAHGTAIPSKSCKYDEYGSWWQARMAPGPSTPARPIQMSTTRGGRRTRYPPASQFEALTKTVGPAFSTPRARWTWPETTSRGRARRTARSSASQPLRPGRGRGALHRRRAGLAGRAFVLRADGSGLQRVPARSPQSVFRGLPARLQSAPSEPSRRHQRG